MGPEKWRGDITAGATRWRSRLLRAAIVALCAATLTSCTARAVGRQEASPREDASAAADPIPAVASGWTLLANLHGSAKAYGIPGGPVTGTVPGSWHGARSVLPVISSRGDYVEVRLAQRPNGATAWLSASSVSFSATPYRILVNLRTTRLTVYKAGREVLGAPAGVGMAASPTPTGHFFVAFLAQPPSSGYGAFVMVTSAHSNAITDYESSGDAMVAIHGPLGAAAEIGTTGARVSHGCVRLQLSDLQQIRDIPAGSPIEIVAS